MTPIIGGNYILVSRHVPAQLKNQWWWPRGEGTVNDDLRRTADQFRKWRAVRGRPRQEQG